MALGCGFTPAQTGEMTLHDYFRIMRYWSKHPPIHILKGIQMGVKPKKPKATGSPAAPQNAANLAALFAMAKNGKIRVEDLQ